MIWSSFPKNQKLLQIWIAKVAKQLAAEATDEHKVTCSWVAFLDLSRNLPEVNSYVTVDSSWKSSSGFNTPPLALIGKWERKIQKLTKQEDARRRLRGMSWCN